jgi:hypothetical protein
MRGRPKMPGPSITRVFNMNKKTLLKHHALIVHKASSLSRKQRDIVQTRVAHGLEKGLYTHDEVNDEISELGLHVAQEINNKLNGYTDGDSSEEY